MDFQHEFRHEVQHPVQIVFLFLGNFSEKEVKMHKRGHDEHGIDKEKQEGIYCPQECHQGPQQSKRISVNNCKKTQYAVENCDSCEVFPWSEMRYPFLYGRIIDLYWLAYQFHSVPRGEYHQFKFCLISGGQQRQTMKFFQRI